MAASTRYLTKSRFKLAAECPRKLYYTGKPDCVDRSIEDSFLAALAEGGYQVGELACLMYPDGIRIDTLEHQKALDDTAELLKRDEVTIFEAAAELWRGLCLLGAPDRGCGDPALGSTTERFAHRRGIKSAGVLDSGSLDCARKQLPSSRGHKSVCVQATCGQSPEQARPSNRVAISLIASGPILSVNPRGVLGVDHRSAVI